MKVITRQFLKEILLSTLFVLTALVALFAFFELIGQLDEVGKGRTIAYALTMTALSLPARIYEVMPLAALLASVYTMSRWSASSEFTVLRAAGMSPLRLAGALLVPGILIVMLTYGVGELAAPWAERYAVEVKTGSDAALKARGYVSGVWLRDVTADETGRQLDRYINVSHLVAGDRNVTGAWRVFEFDDKGRLVRLVRSRSAVFEPGSGWHLKEAVETRYPELDPAAAEPTEKRIETVRAADFFFSSTLGPDILSVMTSKPEDMSMRDLDKYVAHLERTNQQSEHYKIAFWSKAFYPLAVLVMIALSMPFAYMNARSGGVVIKIFFGVMIGIVFYAMNNLFSYLGILNTWSPIAVTILPTVVMLFAAAAALWWVERR